MLDCSLSEVCDILYCVDVCSLWLWEIFCLCRILQEHIKKLSQVIQPYHKDLRIPKVYHGECPWPAAQSEIYMIGAYKVGSLEISSQKLSNRGSMVSVTSWNVSHHLQNFKELKFTMGLN